MEAFLKSEDCSVGAEFGSVEVKTEQEMMMLVANPMVAEGQKQFVRKAQVIIANSNILLEILEKCIVSVR